MTEGIRVPMIPRAKPSEDSTPIRTHMAVKTRKQTELEQRPKTPTVELAKIYTIKSGRREQRLFDWRKQGGT